MMSRKRPLPAWMTLASQVPSHTLSEPQKGQEANGTSKSKKKWKEDNLTKASTEFDKILQNNLPEILFSGRLVYSHHKSDCSALCEDVELTLCAIDDAFIGFWYGMACDIWSWERTTYSFDTDLYKPRYLLYISSFVYWLTSQSFTELDTESGNKESRYWDWKWSLEAGEGFRHSCAQCYKEQYGGLGQACQWCSEDERNLESGGLGQTFVSLADQQRRWSEEGRLDNLSSVRAAKILRSYRCLCFIYRVWQTQVYEEIKTYLLKFLSIDLHVLWNRTASLYNYKNNNIPIHMHNEIIQCI